MVHRHGGLALPEARQDEAGGSGDSGGEGGVAARRREASKGHQWRVDAMNVARTATTPGVPATTVATTVGATAGSACGSCPTVTCPSRRVGRRQRRGLVGRSK